MGGDAAVVTLCEEVGARRACARLVLTRAPPCLLRSAVRRCPCAALRCLRGRLAAVARARARASQGVPLSADGWTMGLRIGGLPSARWVGFPKGSGAYVAWAGRVAEAAPQGVPADWWVETAATFLKGQVGLRKRARRRERVGRESGASTTLCSWRADHRKRAACLCLLPRVRARRGGA